jgi:nicotinamidase/pyrazinamidase
VQRYDRKTALIVVDVQNDFADPNGGLSVAGAPAVIPTMNTEIESARDNGGLVVYTLDWHPPSTPHFAKDGGTWPVHCVAGTWGAEFYPALLLVDDPVIVKKGSNGEDGYSGFTMRDPVTEETKPTELEQILRDSGIERLVLVGLATDYCINATALDAIRLGFETRVLTDACRPVDLQRGDGRRAIEGMRAAGIIASQARTRSQAGTQ